MNCYIRSHKLARDLLSRPDGFITATVNGDDKEYAIESFKRVATCANIDDSTGYWTLILQKDSESET